MCRNIGRLNWKWALILFGIYLVAELILISVLVLLNPQGNLEILMTILASGPIWTTLLVPGIILLLGVLLPPQVFVPLIIVVFGAFLTLSSLNALSQIGAAVKAAFFDVNLFSAGVAVIAIGLAFMQLYGKSTHKETKTK